MGSRRHELRGVLVRAALAARVCLPRLWRRTRSVLNSRAHTHECLDCGRQTSITAGTAMHRSKLPVTVRLRAAHLMAAHLMAAHLMAAHLMAAHLMATHSNGMSEVQFESQLGITYKTVWLLAQKLRRSEDLNLNLPVGKGAEARLDKLVRS
jgi:hypothetical protein